MNTLALDSGKCSATSNDNARSYFLSIIIGWVRSRGKKYFLSIRRRDKIPRSDLIAIVEDIEGVDSVNLHFVSDFAEQRKANAALVRTSLVASDLDSFGDIIIGRDVLPIIRGGWKDAKKFEYQSGLDMTKPSSVNINIKSVIPVTHNTRVNSETKNNIKSTPKPGNKSLGGPSIAL